MDLQDGPGSWWDADSPGSDDVEHARESSSSPQSWQFWVVISHQRSGTGRAIEDLLTKFAENQYIGNITTQNSVFQAEVMLAIQTLTNQQKQSATIVSCGPVPMTPRASPQPQLLQLSQSKRPAGDKADGDDTESSWLVRTTTICQSISWVSLWFCNQIWPKSCFSHCEAAQAAHGFETPS